MGDQAVRGEEGPCVVLASVGHPVDRLVFPVVACGLASVGDPSSCHEVVEAHGWDGAVASGFVVGEVEPVWSSIETQTVEILKYISIKNRFNRIFIVTFQCNGGIQICIFKVVVPSCSLLRKVMQELSPV